MAVVYQACAVVGIPFGAGTPNPHIHTNPISTNRWTMWIQRKIMARIHKDPKFFDLDAEWCVPNYVCVERPWAIAIGHDQSMNLKPEGGA